MNTYRKNAMIAGILLLVAIVVPLASFPFSGFAQGPDDLTRIAEDAGMVKIGMILEIIMAFACAGIAIWLYPVLRKYNRALALGAVGARIIEAALYLVGVVFILAVTAVSQDFVAGTVSADLTSPLFAGREAAGIMGSLAFILGASMYYFAFFRSRLIPRWLAAWGLIGVPLWIVAEMLVMFGSVDPTSTTLVVLQLPIALNEITLAIWLISKGFNIERLAELNND